MPDKIRQNPTLVTEFRPSYRRSSALIRGPARFLPHLRLTYVTRFALWVSLFALPAVAAPRDLMSVLKAVETRYNNAKTLEVHFQQQYRQGRRTRQESGELYLRKPGRMRWAYTQPAGKLFISDGKYMYLWVPDQNRVERTSMKETEDMRAPLAFLLGRLDFNRDFGKYITRPEGDGLRIEAEPKSEKMPYSKVDFTIDAGNRIRHLVITGQDQSVMEFTFDNEKINPPLAENLFRFQAPPGAEVVEGSQ